MESDAMRDEQPVESGKVFLFLQGVASPLFARLADELEHRGHRCLRVNFCPGDRLFWRRPGAIHYRGRYDEWPEFLRELIAVENVTDILLFSDVRPLHHLACREALRLGLRVHVFEEGYLRPYCLTLDLGGANANSSLPKSTDDFLAQATSGAAPQRVAPVPISMLHRAIWDIANHTANLTFPWLHPHYRSHRPHHPLRELGGWSRRILRRHALGERRRHRRSLDHFLAGGNPFFLVPLQLDSDAQVVKHSDFHDIGEFLEVVFESFARCAPADAHLVVKCHPLDNDLVPRGRQTARLAVDHGIEDRVLFADGGHLPSLLGKARGLVTINSTVATSAFDHGCPVKALGRAIFNVPGLAAEDSLDEFWNSPVSADPRVHRAFCQVLFDHCLVRGSFYSDEGIALAVPALADLLERRVMRQANARE
jgi:capsular polysaccharide export protein